MNGAESEAARQIVRFVCPWPSCTVLAWAPAGTRLECGEDGTRLERDETVSGVSAQAFSEALMPLLTR